MPSFKQPIPLVLVLGEVDEVGDLILGFMVVERVVVVLAIVVLDHDQVLAAVLGVVVLDHDHLLTVVLLEVVVVTMESAASLTSCRQNLSSFFNKTLL